ncbi:MAG: non-ribosomal peptide synthetase, partial [Polyangiaceae bacterium]
MTDSQDHRMTSLNEQPADHDPFAGPAILTTAPTTEPQREVWIAAQMSREASLAYNESVTLWMAGPLDLDALRASLADVVLRHEALRSTFSGDGMTMIVAADADVPVHVIDGAGLTGGALEAKWQGLLAREVTEAFDLEHGPLARVNVLGVGPEEHRVTFTAHHLVCDGWSTAVVVREWAALYSSRVRGVPAALAPADRFSAYARDQRSSEHALAVAADEAYWVAGLAEDAPILEFPVDRPRPPLKSYPSRREDRVLDEALVRDVRRLGSAERASLFATLLAGFEVLLARLTGQQDLIVGIPSAGQSVGGHDDLVGHCVNILPLRASVRPEESIRALLGQARTVVLDAYDHQRCTFGSLLKRLPLARDPSRLPLVSVLFNVDRGMAEESIPFEGIRTELTSNPRHFENFDLFLNAVELSGKVTLECQYNADLFDADTVRRWLAAYECLLRSACERPDERVGWLAITTVAEESTRRAVQSAENTRGISVPTCVHDLIEAQAARSPEAVAVVSEARTLTYAELNSRAEALAWRLRDLGVARGSLVGLCTERSADMIVGLLGILKSGAAYGPLDPGYPVDRLAFMVRDSKMSALVTEEKLASELRLGVEHVVFLEGLSPRRERLPKEGGATPEDAAYVIYTSGSTGTPKGVLVPHRAVVNLLTSVKREPGITSSDALLAVT